jgi:hypothetical protein
MTAAEGTDINALAGEPDSKPLVFGIAIQALRVFDSLASIFRYIEEITLQVLYLEDQFSFQNLTNRIYV